jgi:protein involved in sex pheromone biosynthesis
MKDLDYNEIEKSLEDIINSLYDPENYFFKPEGTE